MERGQEIGKNKVQTTNLKLTKKIIIGGRVHLNKNFTT